MKRNKIECIKYTLNHKKAFLETEKRLIGYNTIRGYLHDVDKLFLYLFFSPEKVTRIHRKYAKHHFNNAIESSNIEDIIQMIIDWESARFTKPDKPLTAREYLYKTYKDRADEIEPILQMLAL